MDCTADVQRLTVPALISFTNDGIVLTSEPPSPLETPGFGSWISIGPKEL
jgi:hypothetical protein